MKNEIFKLLIAIVWLFFLTFLFSAGQLVFANPSQTPDLNEEQLLIAYDLEITNLLPPTKENPLNDYEIEQKIEELEQEIEELDTMNAQNSGCSLQKNQHNSKLLRSLSFFAVIAMCLVMCLKINSEK